MSTHLIEINGGRRVDTRKEHAARIALAGLEACAAEGARIRQASAAIDAPDLFEPTTRGRSRVWDADHEEVRKLGPNLFLLALGIVLGVLILGFSLWKFSNRAPAVKVVPSGVITMASTERGEA